MEIAETGQIIPDNNDNNSLKYLQKIIEKDGFSIDESKAKEFITFCELPDDANNKSPLGQVCYHCCIADDTNKIIKFIQSYTHNNLGGGCHNKQSVYINKNGIFNECNQNESMPSTDHHQT